MRCSEFGISLFLIKTSYLATLSEQSHCWHESSKNIQGAAHQKACCRRLRPGGQAVWTAGRTCGVIALNIFLPLDIPIS